MNAPETAVEKLRMLKLTQSAISVSDTLDTASEILQMQKKFGDEAKFLVYAFHKDAPEILVTSCDIQADEIADRILI